MPSSHISKQEFSVSEGFIHTDLHPKKSQVKGRFFEILVFIRLVKRYAVSLTLDREELGPSALVASLEINCCI